MERVPGSAASSEAVVAKISDVREAMLAHLVSVESAILFSGRQRARRENVPKTED